MVTKIENMNDIIGERYRFFNEMFAKGDFAKLINEFYTDDIVLAGEGIPLLKGRPDAQILLEQMAGSVKDISVDIVMTRQLSGDTVYNFCEISAVKRENNEPIKFKSIVIFRKNSNLWQCEAELFTSGSLFE